MKLYNFWRSGTSHRLRIALNLKGVASDYIPVHLGKEEHLSEAYQLVNPQMLVPALDTGEGVLIQSPAIIEWLEEEFPQPALLPVDPFGRARVRALAAIVGCDIHPINNRRILEHLRKDFGASEESVNAWCQLWVNSGFQAYESLLANDVRRGQFSFGNTPSLADVYLIPQVESARRFKVDLSPYPLILSIDAACSSLDAFERAKPAAQPDAS